MCSERVTEGVAVRMLGDPGRAQRAAHGALHHRLMQVMPPALTGERVDVVTGRREDRLPSDLARCPRILTRQGVR